MDTGRLYEVNYSIMVSGKSKIETCWNYGWEQGKKKLSIVLCIYCNYQLKGEMLKQQAIDEMVEQIRLED